LCHNLKAAAALNCDRSLQLSLLRRDRGVRIPYPPPGSLSGGQLRSRMREVPLFAPAPIVALRKCRPVRGGCLATGCSASASDGAGVRDRSENRDSEGGFVNVNGCYTL